MANEEHLARLNQGVQIWNQWRDGHPIRGDLRLADLFGADLFVADLAEANLRGVSIAEADLTGANLRETNLTKALLFGSRLTGASLARANLTEAELTEANLKGAFLTRADLAGADLTGANLTEAKLAGVILAGIHLIHANLTEANLREANLAGANLTNAVLDTANLTEANLTGAHLAGANLTWATFEGTTLGNLDLSTVQGIEMVQHHGPSTIGIDTLYRSQGDIPKVFLQGTGIPEDFIPYIKSLVGRPFEFYSCFISYNHTDKSFARRLHDQLQGRGIRCWLDEHQMRPGDDIYEEIDRGIKFWDKVLLCCSQVSLTSWWVDNEIDTAFEKEGSE